MRWGNGDKNRGTDCMPMRREASDWTLDWIAVVNDEICLFLNSPRLWRWSHLSRSHSFVLVLLTELNFAFLPFQVSTHTSHLRRSNAYLHSDRAGIDSLFYDLIHIIVAAAVVGLIKARSCNTQCIDSLSTFWALTLHWLVRFGLT